MTRDEFRETAKAAIDEINTLPRYGWDEGLIDPDEAIEVLEKHFAAVLTPSKSVFPEPCPQCGQRVIWVQ